ncbi:TlpA family protein disulfide reductase [Paludisphaera rhizosphaerae]|uniref:TlpA family protein disulfide reductase n=1 Tax=Paludisphaera rhizosphaerae TaxID=2711216 RepID=UPI0013EB72F7|nr:TlpA disulfide reductase family protein [Paludisphaera rhizosphaerae]
MTTLAAILLLASSLPAQASDSLEARCDALYREFADAQRKWSEASHRGTPGESGTPRPDGAAFARKFLAMAKEHPDDPAAALALSRAMCVDPFGASWGETLDAIEAKHVASPEIGPVLSTISFDLTRPKVEPFLRRVMQENPSAEVRADAALALAEHLRRIARQSKDLREHPGLFEREGLTAADRDVMSRVRDRDGEALRREVEQILELVTRDYAGVVYDESRKLTYADRARTLLHEIRDLTVGKPAPEITGVDSQGRPMKLSEHRGKVVALIWWASWCAPCMAMVPHERELAERYKDRPFVILGVNGDEDAARMRSQIQEQRVSWRSWADGGPEGPISTAWNVKSWPTVYVLDPDGVIRYKGGMDEKALDRAVEALMTRRD